MTSQNPFARVPGNFEPWNGLVECSTTSQCIDAAQSANLSQVLSANLESRIECKLFDNVGAPNDALVPKVYCSCTLEQITLIPYIGRACENLIEVSGFVYPYFLLVWLTETGIVATTFYRIFRAVKLGMHRTALYKDLSVLSAFCLFSLHITVTMASKLFQEDMVSMDLTLEMLKFSIACLILAMMSFATSMLILLNVFRVSRFGGARKGQRNQLPFDLKVAMIVLNSGYAFSCILILTPGTNLYMKTQILVLPLAVAGAVLVGFVSKEAIALRSDMKKATSDCKTNGQRASLSEYRLSQIQVTMWRFIKHSALASFAAILCAIIQLRQRKNYKTVGSPDITMHLFGPMMLLSLVVLFALPAHFTLSSFYGKIGMRGGTKRGLSAGAFSSSVGPSTGGSSLSASSSSD